MVLWRMVPRTLLALAAFAASVSAQTPPNVHTASVTFSVSGGYSSSEYRADLTGSGQFTYLGAVHFSGTVEEPNKGYCDVFLHFFSDTPITYQTPRGTTFTSTAEVEAFGRGLPCDVGVRVDTISSAAAQVWAIGGITAGGTQATYIQGGYLTFSLTGFVDNWVISGQGELNLLPNGQQAQGPGGSGYPAVAGPGGSGYPVVVNGGNSGTVLVFDNAGSIAAADRPHASNGANSIEIPLPVQAAAATYTVSASCLDSPTSCWIDIPTTSGSIAASTGVSITANLNPQGFSPGVYPANVAITITPTSGQNGQPPAPTTQNVPLTAVVTSAGSMLALSQTGLQFQALANSGPIAQSVTVSDLPRGQLTFSAKASTVSGGSWLSVSPETGTASTVEPAAITIQANPPGLAPGTYFGRVDVAAPGSVGSPQSIGVAFTVLPASNSVPPVISPTGLTFVANSTSSPAPQTIQVSNLSNQPLALSASAFTDDGADWLTVSSATGTATPAQPFVESITVDPTGLAAGVYNGSVVFVDTNNSNNSYSVPVQFIVPSAAPCTPTQLLPMITTLQTNFQTMAAFPVPLQVQIVDDCGSPLTAGSVTAAFSSDPALSMLPLGNGQWSGTWQPHHIEGAGAAVTVSANSPTLYGLDTIAGTVSANPSAPVVSEAAIVSAASLTTTPLAPGGYISIFGSNLASGSNAAPGLPDPTNLGGTQVLLGGEPLPLQYAGNGQINALIPYDAAVDGIQQLIVKRGNSYSPPETVVVAEAQPAVFTQNQRGSGGGAIMVVKSDGTQFLNTPSAPASAGDALVIYCTGLGAVTPVVAAGTAAPSSPLSKTANPVTVSIGGQTQSAAFAGLTPGYAGLYQVNVTVPAGISASNDVPVVITVANQSSPPVTVAIR